MIGFYVKIWNEPWGEGVIYIIMDRVIIPGDDCFKAYRGRNITLFFIQIQSKYYLILILSTQC